MNLNRNAHRLVVDTLGSADHLRIRTHDSRGGGRVLDFGVEAPGGLDAGAQLARITLAGLASVRITAGEVGGTPCPVVTTRTDHPVAACMASQYAGWRISVGAFFGMGSGPFRALYGREDLYDAIGHREDSDVAVGVIETSKLPGDDVFDHLAEKLGRERSAISLAVARTSSLAGGVQIVARSVETALHKLHALGFDLSRVVAGQGWAPLPPPGKDDLESLGRTNDAVLYGGRVMLWVRGDDESLEEIAPKVPSSSSKDHGKPFGETFREYEFDFYKIDAGLFSPAEVVLSNIDTGRSFRAGKCEEKLLTKSFFGS